MTEEEIYTIRRTLRVINISLKEFSSSAKMISEITDFLPSPHNDLLLGREFYPFPNCFREISNAIGVWDESLGGFIKEIIEHPLFRDPDWSDGTGLNGIRWLWHNWNYIECLAEEAELDEAEGKQPKHSFCFQGVSVTNPFLEETGRFEVNPILYYGVAFLNSSFCKP